MPINPVAMESPRSVEIKPLNELNNNNEHLDVTLPVLETFPGISFNISKKEFK